MSREKLSQMGHLKAVILIFLSLSALLSPVEAQASGLPRTDPSVIDDSGPVSFQPSLAVVIGVLSIMFGLTFALLVYAKFCHSRPAALHIGALVGISRRFSGIDKTVIESLPFFRFSSLKGSKQGLECAVCLSKFEDIEVLRLLPMCKHAFHINCIDQWLERHSTCPLCRLKVNPDDPAIFAYTNSMRFSVSRSQHREREGSNLELYVQREEAKQQGSSRSLNEDEIPIQHHYDHEHGVDDADKALDKLNHQIIVSDAVFKNRWSDVSSSDLIFLNSQLLHDMSTSNGVSSVEANGNGSTARIANPDRRSMSEITAQSRFGEIIMSDEKEERRRSLWLPIARRTAEWYANRGKSSDQQLKSTTQDLDVV